MGPLGIGFFGSVQVTKSNRVIGVCFCFLEQCNEREESYFAK